MEQVKFVEDSLSFVSIIFHDFLDIITIWVKGYRMPQILKNMFERDRQHHRQVLKYHSIVCIVICCIFMVWLWFKRNGLIVLDICNFGTFFRMAINHFSDLFLLRWGLVCHSVIIFSISPLYYSIANIVLLAVHETCKGNVKAN